MARKRRSTTEINTAENASVPKRRYTRLVAINIYKLFIQPIFLIIQQCMMCFFYSAQRSTLEEMMVFNHRKCLTWFHKYTNNLSDNLGIYKTVNF